MTYAGPQIWTICVVKLIMNQTRQGRPLFPMKHGAPAPSGPNSLVFV
jgi:hypothetical protein